MITKIITWPAYWSPSKVHSSKAYFSMKWLQLTIRFSNNNPNWGRPQWKIAFAVNITKVWKLYGNIIPFNFSIYDKETKLLHNSINTTGKIRISSPLAATEVHQKDQCQLAFAHCKRLPSVPSNINNGTRTTKLALSARSGPKRVY